MAKFTEIEDQLLQRVTEDRLHTSLAAIRQAAEDIWAADAPRIIQDYTDHGIYHSERLADYAAQLLAANDGRSLSAEETYLLLAGIYLHDIGMQCDVVKYPEIKTKAEAMGAKFDVEFTAKTASSYTIDEQKTIRKNHHLLTGAWIDHARRTGETVLGPAIRTVPDELVGDLIDVCKYHAKLPISECPVTFTLDERGRKQLVTALVRFADELDMDGHRVSIETVKNFRLDPRNAVYWWLHQLTKVIIAGNVITLTTRLHPDDEQCNGPLVREAFIEKFRTKNRSVLGVLRQNSIPIAISADSGVVPYEYADPLPNDIVQALQLMQGKKGVLDELADEVKTWLEAIGYEVSDPTGEGRTRDMVATLQRGLMRQQVLVRCFEGEIAQADLEALEAEPSPQKWAISEMRVAPSAREYAEAQPSVQVFNLADFMRLIWGPYFDYLTALVEESDIPRYYVDLGCHKKEIDEEGREIARDTYPVIDDYIDDWLSERGKLHISLLGEFGTGKTWFCRHYAYRQLECYLDDPIKERLPLLITLRAFTKAMTAQQLINDALLEQYKLPFVGSAFDIFQEMNRRGKLLLILDGFDEMARKVEYQTVVDNFWELAQVVVEGSKVLLTSRTEYFRWVKESENVLGGEELGRKMIIIEPPKFEVLYLEPFSSGQIKEVIVKRVDPENGPAVARRILDTPNLAALARKPVLIELLLAALPEIEVREELNEALVYLYATSELLLRNITAERTFTTTADKLFFLCELAWEMIRSGEMRIHYIDIPERIKTWFGDRIEDKPELDHWDYDLRNQTLLQRDAVGYYEFAHKSLAEYFVVYKFAAEMSCLALEFTKTYCEVDGRPCNLPFVRKDAAKLAETFGAFLLSDKRMQAVRDLLRGMVGDADRLWAVIDQTKGKILEDIRYVGGNAATVLNQMGESFVERDLAGTVLAGADLTNVDLAGADLRGAILRQAILQDANLKNVMLQNADLTYVDCRARDLAIVEPKYLIALLENVTVCSRAAAALGMARSKEAIPPLLNLLGRDDEHIRGTAALALGMIRSPKVILHLIPMLDDSHYYVRGEAAVALGLLRATEAVPELMRSLNDEHEHVRGTTCEALGRIGAVEAVPELIRLLNDEHEHVRGMACEALGRIGAVEAVPELMRLLSGEHSHVRGRAAEALGRIGATEAVPKLIRLLDDEHGHIRGRATEALGRIGATEAVPKLIRLLDDEHEHVRGRAAEALGELRAAEATPQLILLLEDEHETVRGGTARALGKLQATEALTQLTSLLDDEYENVRIRAAIALKRIRTSVPSHDQTEPEL